MVTISGVLIGILLGLVGGGGSILTVPVLVYQLNIDPTLATAYSLFVVGVSATFGSISYFRKGLINLKVAGIFSLPSVLAVYFTRLWIIPGIPDPISFPIFSFNASFSKATGIMLLFTSIMFSASYFMLFKKDPQDITETEAITAADHLHADWNYAWIGIEGFLVGILTGLVGAGGGFLIVPVLVTLAKIPIKQAVGISLFIISLKSLIGFVGDLQGNQVIDWAFLLEFSSFMVIGIFGGTYLSRFFSDQRLKKIFGVFILVIGIYILKKELLKS